VKIAKVDPLGLGAEPVRKIRESVQQVLVAILPIHGRLQGKKKIFGIVANIDTNFTRVILTKELVLALSAIML
jgi:hypothetical protein